MQVFNKKIIMMIRKNKRKSIVVPIAALLLSLCTIQSCTDLEPNFTDSVDTSGDSGSASFGGVANSASTLDALYTSGASNGLGIYNTTTQTDDYALSEVAADNVAVLTRGADWSDNGVWRVLHAHTCLLYKSPSPRDKRQSRMPSSA